MYPTSTPIHVVNETYQLADLRNWKQIVAESKTPIGLGVLGDPVAHSLSPQMQNAALKHCGIAMRYARFHILPNELGDALKLIRGLEFIGVNLTVPHKVAALEWLDETDPGVRSIGAVNTLALNGGKLRGYNTDAEGFRRAIHDAFSVELRDLRVLLLGTGGVARAIAAKCVLEQCPGLVLAGRSFDKAKRLANRFNVHAIQWSEATIGDEMERTDLVVNATPLGLGRGDPSPIPSRLLAPHLMIYDTNYAREATALIIAAELAGARAADGRTMLIHQGALAFAKWFHRPAPLDVMSCAVERA